MSEAFGLTDLRDIEAWLAANARPIAGFDMIDPALRNLRYRPDLKGFQAALTWSGKGMLCQNITADHLRKLGLGCNRVSQQRLRNNVTFSCAVILRGDDWSSLAVQHLIMAEDN